MKILIICFTTLFALTSFAQVYKGETKMKAKKSIELKGPIKEILDGENDYRVLIGINAAFYSFPKTAQKKEVLDLLTQSKKEGFPIKASVDPLTLKILTLEKVDKK